MPGEIPVCPYGKKPAPQCAVPDSRREPHHLRWHLQVLVNEGLVEETGHDKWKFTKAGVALLTQHLTA